MTDRQIAMGVIWIICCLAGIGLGALIDHFKRK